MKGIVLAGGRGTRLYPLTKGLSKQLLPVYDKPMIYYPLSMLMLAGICEILVIGMPHQLPLYQSLLGDGDQWGLEIVYKEQAEPRGLADAFVVGKEFIDGEEVCLILGDNIFYGHDLPKVLRRAVSHSQGATIFAYAVKDPERYGIVEFDEDHKVISLEEKPEKPRSRYAVPGIYFYDHIVVELVEKIKPSPRGELEITDLNLEYLKKGELRVEVLGRGVAWLDAGTPEALLQAGQFVYTLEDRQGMKISCLEEIAYRMGFISLEKLENVTSQLSDNSYRNYLLHLLSTEFKPISGAGE